jgi:hypothetical protein
MTSSSATYGVVGFPGTDYVVERCDAGSAWVTPAITTMSHYETVWISPHWQLSAPGAQVYFANNMAFSTSGELIIEEQPVRSTAPAVYTEEVRTGREPPTRGSRVPKRRRGDPYPHPTTWGIPPISVEFLAPPPNLDQMAAFANAQLGWAASPSFELQPR